MRMLSMFNQISVDGFFKSASGDISWMHDSTPDPEFDAWVGNNASGGGALMFGRVTFQGMEAFWPTPMAMEQMPAVSKGMTAAKKLVFSNTLKSSTWANTHFFTGDVVEEVKKLKASNRPEWGGDKPIVILGSGTLVSPLLSAGLLDELQLLVIPTLLGQGTLLFQDAGQHGLKLTGSRAFKNGRVSLQYRRA